MSFHSNCLFWARAEYARRLKEWRDGGSKAGEEPYWVSRPSRSEPRCVTHFMLGRYNAATDSVIVESFKPEDPVDVPWWAVVAHIYFKGDVEYGDAPKIVWESVTNDLTNAE